MNMSIPAFHVSDISRVKGLGTVHLLNRKDATAPGTFSVRIDAHFDPGADDYPTGSLLIDCKLNDGLQAAFTATSIELMNSYGRAGPTVYLTGRCKADTDKARGLRYWLMIASNAPEKAERSPDVAAFAVHDRTGARVAYGAGAVDPNQHFSVAPK